VPEVRAGVTKIGNSAAPVTADTVATVRKETAARTEPFKGDVELMPLK